MVRDIFSAVGAAIWNYIREADKLLAVAVLTLSAFGVVAISSATMYDPSLQKRSVMLQLIAIGLGFVIMVVLSKIDYDVLSELSPYIVAAAFLVLLYTAFFAPDVNGNKNWLYIGPVSIQPSEVTKALFALTMAAHLRKIGGEPSSFKNVLFLGLHLLCYLLPIVLQKDIGSALVYLCAFAVLLFMSGLQFRYLIAGGVIVVAAVPLIWEFLSTYQKARIIYGFQPELDPLGYGLQPLVSKIALGSGGLTGLGYGNGIQTQNDLLPASSTDFIFGIIGEEFGFVGCVFVIVMLLLIVTLIAIDAAKAKDYCGKYICVTVAAIIAIQTVINIGMCVGLSPVIGITLPFVSYGGSSVLSMYICLGLVQGTRIRREKVLNFARR